MQDILATSTTCHTDSVTSEFLSILHKCLNLEENFDFRFPFGGDHPNRYDIPDINRFRDEYLFSNIVRKYAGPSSDSASLRNRAIEDALAAEAHCSQHYTRFNNQGSFGSLRATPEAVLFTAAAHCSAVLGEFNWAEVFKSCDYGPGASTTLAKKSSVTDITRSAITPESVPDAFLSWKITFVIFDPYGRGFFKTGIQPLIPFATGTASALSPRISRKIDPSLSNPAGICFSRKGSAR